MAEAAMTWLVERVRGCVRDFTKGEDVVKWLDDKLETLRPQVETMEDDKKLTGDIRDMIRKAEDLAGIHTKMKIQVDASPFKAIIYQLKIWNTSMQLHRIKGEISKWSAYPTHPMPNTAEMQTVPPYLRRCEFYLLLFPPDYQVPARRLIVLWVAEGVVHPRKNDKRSAEQIARGYLKELWRLGSIDVVEEKCRGKLTCSIKSSRRNELMKEANSAEFLQRGKGEIRRLVDHNDDSSTSFIKIQGNYTAPESLKSYRGVISFLSFNTREGSKPGEDIGDFLQRCISSGCFDSIRVLDLERVFRPKLPDTLGRLITMKYLGLRWTYLEQLPNSVEKLFNLQVLDVKNTYISVLPRSIWRMQFLTHLYLSEAYRTRFPQKSSQVSLTALHTLWGAFIDEDTPVQGGLDTLLNVCKLGLSCMPRASAPEESQGQSVAVDISAEQSEEAIYTPLISEEQPEAIDRPLTMEQQLEAINKWISKLEFLESLRLKSRDKDNKAAHLSLTSLESNRNLSKLYLLGKLINDLIINLPASLTNIMLSGSDLQSDPLEFLGKLPNLTILRLLGQSVGCSKMSCSEKAFPKLKLLWIWKLEKLEGFEAKEGSMPCLEELEIRNCQNLEALPRPLLYIPKLEIKLTEMPQKIEDDARKINPSVKIIRQILTHPSVL